MTPEQSNLIAGILIVVVGVFYLALPAIKQFKEKDPEISHLRFKHWALSILTIMVGLLVAANRGDEVWAMIRNAATNIFAPGAS